MGVLRRRLLFPEASRPLAGVALVGVASSFRGLLPALFRIAAGTLIGAVQRGDPLAGPLTFVGIVFVSFQVLTPLHQAVSSNLGSRTTAWLYDRLIVACIRPQGMGHLERPELTNDLTIAHDFDLGITGPACY